MTHSARSLPQTPSTAPEADTALARIGRIVQRMLVDRAISRAVAPDDDLRLAGLSSLDLVTLVLEVEAEFDVTVPEQSIVPINFRSIASISRLITSLLHQS